MGNLSTFKQKENLCYLIYKLNQMGNDYPKMEGMGIINIIKTAIECNDILNQEKAVASNYSWIHDWTGTVSLIAEKIANFIQTVGKLPENRHCQEIVRISVGEIEQTRLENESHLARNPE